MGPEGKGGYAEGRLAERLPSLRILVGCDLEGSGQGLLRHLQKSRASVRHCWPLPEVIGSDADLVICDHAAGLGQRLAWPPGEPLAALILTLPQSGRYNLDEIQGACPDAVLARPFTLPQVDVAVMLALDHFSYGRRQRSRIDRLEENLKSIRTIEKAKLAIMAREKVDDEGAFRILRSLAMTRRMTVAAVAGRIVDSEDLLTYKT